MLFYLKFFLFCFVLISSPLKSQQIETKEDIEKIIENYLLKNPEILIQSLEKYRSNQEAKMDRDRNAYIEAYFKEKKHETLPFTGNIKGNIIITEFIDYNCSYCKKTLSTINKLVKKYNNLKVVFVDFPILSETSLSAAKACLAAFNQNVYFKYHSALLKSNKEISESYLLDLAKSLDLNMNKFKEDMISDEIEIRVKNNIEFARKLNIRGTPTFIINNKVYPGAYDIDKLEDIINSIL